MLTVETKAALLWGMWCCDYCTCRWCSARWSHAFRLVAVEPFLRCACRHEAPQFSTHCEGESRKPRFPSRQNQGLVRAKDWRVKPCVVA
jgi:hypothetical protein